jgi:hypothetical protein
MSVSRGQASLVFAQFLRRFDLESTLLANGSDGSASARVWARKDGAWAVVALNQPGQLLNANNESAARETAAQRPSLLASGIHTRNGVPTPDEP